MKKKISKIWYVGLVVLLAMVSLIARPVSGQPLNITGIAVTPANYAAGKFTS